MHMYVKQLKTNRNGAPFYAPEFQLLLTKVGCTALRFFLSLELPFFVSFLAFASSEVEFARRWGRQQRQQKEKLE